jgi:hypothetical protein
MPQDYLMRLIEQIGQMLASILTLRRAGRNEEAAQEIDAMCLQTAGLPLDRIRKSSPESIAAALATSGALRHARAITLAELLMQDAELSEAAGRKADGMLSRLHAFCLLSDSIDVLGAEEQSIYRQKLTALAATIEACSADPYVHERLRRYAAAEATRL